MAVILYVLLTLRLVFNWWSWICENRMDHEEKFLSFMTKKQYVLNKKLHEFESVCEWQDKYAEQNEIRHVLAMTNK